MGRKFERCIAIAGEAVDWQRFSTQKGMTHRGSVQLPIIGRITLRPLAAANTSRNSGVKGDSLPSEFTMHLQTSTSRRDRYLGSFRDLAPNSTDRQFA